MENKIGSTLNMLIRYLLRVIKLLVSDAEK